MAVKKKRTAKQIAATKRLVAFNKKRRSKKKTRRTNPKRPSSKKSHLWMVFACDGKRVAFLSLTGRRTEYTINRGRMVLFKTKAVAVEAAKNVPAAKGYKVGIANVNTSVTEIRGSCAPKK